MEAILLRLTVNGEAREARVAPLERLLDVLRERLGLTGTKEGCGEGECGACSVVLDGALVNACLVPACQAQGAEVTTIEGLAAGAALASVQRAFLERGGAQCGICTPGMILAAHCFLETGEAATDEAVREAIAGNLCRCTGYQKIVEAIQLAADEGQTRSATPHPSPPPAEPVEGDRLVSAPASGGEGLARAESALLSRGATGGEGCSRAEGSSLSREAGEGQGGGSPRASPTGPNHRSSPP
ncbi:MAG: (2Fe-2S)-binding protein [Deltaproteobacteria bacterium]